MDLIPTGSQAGDQEAPPPRQPTRLEVRALATHHHAQLHEVRAAGGNTQQLVYDHDDAVKQFAAALEEHVGPDAAALFLQMYHEEWMAIHEHTMQQIERDTRAAEVDLAQTEAELAQAQAANAAAATNAAAAAQAAAQPEAPDWRQQSLGEQITRGLIAGGIVVAIMAYCSR